MSTKMSKRMPGMFLAQNTQNALWCQTHTHINTQNTKHKKDRNLPLFQPQFLHPFRRVHPREQDEKHRGGGTGLLESLVHVERGLFHKNRAQLHRDEMLNLTRQAILPHGAQQPVEIEKGVSVHVEHQNRTNSARITTRYTSL